MKILTRASWGADPPREKPTVLPQSEVTELYVHYSGADSDEQSDHFNCPRRVKGIQAFHRNARGWNDIAYNFLFCKHGYVFTGRGWDVQSAATGHRNPHSLAICFLGDDSVGRDDLTTDGAAALVNFCHTVKTRYNHPIKILGHRDAMSTECPGDQIYAFINSGDFKRGVERGILTDEWRYWRWLSWTLGEGDYKGRGTYSKPRPSEALFPRNIPRTWQARRLAYLARRKMT